MCFSRHFNGWELGIVESFFSRLQDKSMRRDVFDRIVWKELKNSAFFVKSLISFLESGRSIPYPSGIIWNSLVLPETSFVGLGSQLGKSSDNRSTSKKMVVVNK